MEAAFAAALVHAALGLELGSAGAQGRNRFALEGVSIAHAQDGALEVRVETFEATTLWLAAGPLRIEVDRLALHKLVATLRVGEGRPQLRSLDAQGAELAGVKVTGAVSLPVGAKPGASAAGPWSLVPLASADGTIRGQIVDAHLLFDADVTVPIRGGQIEFRDATVEHVGPDSRMGVSRLGLYVDAPNGRSYLYQFPSAPVAGVEYERRGALLGPWVTDRGRLQLQPFGESVLRQPGGAPAMGLTEQARQLFDRTALSGDLQLGDGRFAAPGVQADFAGRADRHNLVRLHSEAVGRGVTLEISSLSLRNAAIGPDASRVTCDEVAAGLTLRVVFEGGKLRLAFACADAKLSGLHLRPQAPPGA